MAKKTKRKYKIKKVTLKKKSTSKQSVLNRRYKNVSLLIKGKKLSVDAVIDAVREHGKSIGLSDNESENILLDIIESEADKTDAKIKLVRKLDESVVKTQKELSKPEIKKKRKKIKFDENGDVPVNFFKGLDDALFIDEDEEIESLREELKEYESNIKTAISDLDQYKSELTYFKNAKDYDHAEVEKYMTLVATTNKKLYELERDFARFKSSEKFKKYMQGYIEIDEKLIKLLEIDPEGVKELYSNTNYSDVIDGGSRLAKTINNPSIKFLTKYVEKHKHLPSLPDETTRKRSSSFGGSDRVLSNGKDINIYFGKGRELAKARELCAKAKGRFKNILTAGAAEIASKNDIVGFNPKLVTPQIAQDLFDLPEKEAIEYAINNSLISIIGKSEVNIKNVNVEGIKQEVSKDSKKKFTKAKKNTKVPTEPEFLRPIIKNNYSELLMNNSIGKKIRGAYKVKMLYDAIIAATVFHTLVTNTPEDDEYTYQKVVDVDKTKKTALTHRNNFIAEHAEGSGEDIIYSRGTVKDDDTLLKDVMDGMSRGSKVITVTHKPDADYIKGAWMMRFKNCTVRAFNTSVDSEQDYVFTRSMFNKVGYGDFSRAATGNKSIIGKIAMVLYNLTKDSKDTDLFFELYNLDEAKFQLLEYGGYDVDRSGPNTGKVYRRRHGVNGGYSWMAPSGFARMTKMYFSSLMNTGYSRNSLNSLIKSTVDLDVSDLSKAKGFEDFLITTDERTKLNVDSIFVIKGI